MKRKINTGDARRMAADDLYDMMDRFINANSFIRAPYFILVVVRNNYQGPAPFTEATESGNVETTEMKLPDKLIHNRIIGPMFRPPAVRQLGTMLWKVDNKKGSLDLVYSLPQDVPTFLEDSQGEVVKKVAESAQGIPLVYQ